MQVTTDVDLDTYNLGYDMDLDDLKVFFSGLLAHKSMEDIESTFNEALIDDGYDHAVKFFINED